MRTLLSRLALRRTPNGDLLSAVFHAHGNAEEVYTKWSNRLQQSTQEMQAGVQRVRQAPGQAAAAKRQKWVNALQDPGTQEKWARNVSAVSLTAWQQRMVDVGIPRVSQGAAAAQDKFVSSFTHLLNFTDSVANQVRSMDDSTPAAREARALAMMRGMRGYRRGA